MIYQCCMYAGRGVGLGVYVVRPKKIVLHNYVEMKTKYLHITINKLREYTSVERDNKVYFCLGPVFIDSNIFMWINPRLFVLI